jgi:hypothetical protein
MKSIFTSIAPILCVAAACYTSSARAGDPTAQAEEKPPHKAFTLDDAFDKLWALPVLYQSDTNPFIQKIAFTGRYQGQLWGLNSNYGSSSGWENRRQRFGGKVEFLKTLEANVTFNLNFDGANTGRFIENFDEFGLIWEPVDAIHIEAGLFKVPITNEWRESSNRIVTIERSDFVNMVVVPRLGGVLASGSVKGFTDGSAFTYGAGLYTAARGEDWELPTFNGGTLIYGGIGYRFSETQTLRFDSSILTADSENNAAAPYASTGALSYDGSFLDKKLRLQADLVYAAGLPGTSDLYGIILLPSYHLTERIELVARYQYLVSNESDGVRLQRRYEGTAPELPTTVGNNYHALYGGVNYYIYKNRMKVMYGIEYSRLDLAGAGAYDQFTLFAAFRVWF